MNSRAYVLAYFRTEAEALHLAVSDAGFTWEALNDNRPILTGSVGTRTLRDPFVFRDHRDGRFHLFATDGWNSDSIVHASSPDLLTWSEQDLVPIMRGVAGTRNTWAPECFWDQEAKLWRVIWSSTTTEPEPPHKYDHRIWEATTADFVTYSEPEVFFDPGYNVIDASVYRLDNGQYLMAFKDERGENRKGTEYKAMRVCRSDYAAGPWQETSGLITPPLTEGPTLYRTGDGALAMLFDHFAEGFFAAMRSMDGGVTWEPARDALRLPEGPRHASVLEVEPAVVQELRRAGATAAGITKRGSLNRGRKGRVGPRGRYRAP